MEGLREYIPAPALSLIVDWIIEKKVQLKISRARKTKFGDYRAPYKGHGHRISVNYNLNPYAFLNTLVHEIAHLDTFVQHRGKVAPHGPEWKRNYQLLMDHFLNKDIFPEDIEQALQRYMLDPSASSCADESLYRAFKRYDKKEDLLLPDGWKQSLLEELPEGARFVLNKRVFSKGKKLRKRYRCIEISSGRSFTVSGLAEVFTKVESLS